MMKRYSIFLLFLLLSFGTKAADSLITIRPYLNELKRLAKERDLLLENPSDSIPADAYSMYLVIPPTLYEKTLMLQFSAEVDTTSTDKKLLLYRDLSASFARLYVLRPELILQTEHQILDAGTIRNEFDVEMNTNKKLSDKLVQVNMETDLGAKDIVLTRKPNFWKLKGDGSLQFTQSHFSGNWYQGGEDNYSSLILLNLKALYDNKRKIQWENYLEMQLGFQTTGSSNKHTFQPTNNLMRLTTKFGLKAYKTLYYSSQIQASTQIVPKYEDQSDKVVTEILSPLDVVVSIGLDWKINLKKFTGSVYVAPLAYNMRYVMDDELVTRYGIEAGKNTYHKLGPNITIRTNFKPWNNISWDSRMYFFSNYKYVNLEWENTVTFTINKYMSSKLFLYPRFDSSKYYGGSDSYWMFKEWLSLGLSYSW